MANDVALVTAYLISLSRLLVAHSVALREQIERSRIKLRAHLDDLRALRVDAELLCLASQRMTGT